MGSDRKVTEAIMKLAGTFAWDKVGYIPCIVNSVNANERTCDCTPIGGNAVTDIPNVQLMAEIEDGILLIPAVNSTVIVCYSTRNVPYITLYSALDKVFLISNSGTQFQGGEFGGLVIIGQLVAKVNNLENAFNDLVTKYNTHTHVLALSSGTGTAAPTATEETTVLTPTVRDDIENGSVTHGE